MAFEKFIATRGGTAGEMGLYDFPVVRIHKSPSTTHFLFIGAIAMREFDLLIGQRVSLFWEKGGRLIGIRLAEGTAYGSLRLLVAGGKGGRGGKISFEGFMKFNQIEDTSACYQLVRQDNGMLVFDLNKPLDAETP